jgi:hypothetical protein
LICTYSMLSASTLLSGYRYFPHVYESSDVESFKIVYECVDISAFISNRKQFLSIHHAHYTPDHSGKSKGESYRLSFQRFSVFQRVVIAVVNNPMINAPIIFEGVRLLSSVRHKEPLTSNQQVGCSSHPGHASSFPHTAIIFQPHNEEVWLI